MRALKYGTAIDIEIKTAKQKGYAVLKIWGPSYSDKAKKKCTVMVSKIGISEEKFATILSRKVIKPLLDSHIKGNDFKENIKHIVQSNDKVKCKKCQKMVNKSYLKTHVQNQHPDCKICRESFITKSELKDHNRKKHSSPSIKIVKEVPEKQNSSQGVSKPFQSECFKCDICSFTAYSKRYLWMHKEKSHKNDPTEEEMIGNKRYVELVKTSSISEPSKKKNKVVEKQSNKEDTKINEMYDSEESR